ncbi:MAG: hypothetical protein LBO71_02205 [Prevotellaceae bacterium]|nr:hypothetical protein [Prevotellaceae bacterium]
MAVTATVAVAAAAFTQKVSAAPVERLIIEEDFTTWQMSDTSCTTCKCDNNVGDDKNTCRINPGNRQTGPSTNTNYAEAYEMLPPNTYECLDESKSFTYKNVGGLSGTVPVTLVNIFVNPLYGSRTYQRGGTQLPGDKGYLSFSRRSTKADGTESGKTEVTTQTPFGTDIFNLAGYLYTGSIPAKVTRVELMLSSDNLYKRGISVVARAADEVTRYDVAIQQGLGYGANWVSIDNIDKSNVELQFGPALSLSDGSNNSVVLPTDYTANEAKGNDRIHIHAVRIYAEVEVENVTVTVPSAAGGSVTGAGSIAPGASANLTATANGGYKFMGWQLNGSKEIFSIENPLAYKAVEDVTITPVFGQDGGSVSVEKAVIDETFADWPALLGSGANPNETNNRPSAYTYTGEHKIALRTGKTPSDSGAVSIKNGAVIPQYGLVGSNEYKGLLAFQSANNNELTVDFPKVTEPTTRLEVLVSATGNNRRGTRINVTNSTDTINYYAIGVEPIARKVTLPLNNASDVTVKMGCVGNTDYDSILSANGKNATKIYGIKLYAMVDLPVKDYRKVTIAQPAGVKVSALQTLPSAGANAYGVLDGDAISLLAEPEFGYSVTGWKVNGADQQGSNANVFAYKPAADVTITPVLQEATRKQLTVKASAGGAINLSPLPLDTVSAPEADSAVYEYFENTEVTVSLTPDYGFVLDSWGTTDTAPATAAAMFKLKIVRNYTVEPNFKANADTVTVWIAQSAGLGAVETDKDSWGEDKTSKADTVGYKFPKNETIKFSAYPAYGYKYSTTNVWYDGETGKGSSTEYSVKLNDNKTLHTTFAEQTTTYKVYALPAEHGSVKITSVFYAVGADKERKVILAVDSAEMAVYSGFSVELTSTPAEGYAFSLWQTGYGADKASAEASLAEGAQGNPLLIDNPGKDTTIVVKAIFVAKKEGVITVMEENFQTWPMHYASGNAPATWRDGTPVGDVTALSPSELFDKLSQYRGQDYAGFAEEEEGKPGESTGVTWQKGPYVRKMAMKDSPTDSVTITATWFASCPDCLPKKGSKHQYKERNVSNVTPGYVALRANTDEKRSTEFGEMAEGDTVGKIVVSGMAHLEEVEIGISASTGNVTPLVFYSLNDNEYTEPYDENIERIGELVTTKDYQKKTEIGEYGFGSVQEGMRMNQRLHVGKGSATGVKLIIAGCEAAPTETNYNFTGTAYIHDLKIVGAPQVITPPNSVKDLLDGKTVKSSFYMLGSTNTLKVESEVDVRTIVIYNSAGVAVKVLENVGGTTADVSSLPEGVYFAYAFDVNSKKLTGGFVKY